MTVSQAGTFNVQEFADAGLPLALGRLYTYAFGTTTFKVAYTDAAGSVQQTYTSDGAGGSYIALNSRGELPAPLYLLTDGPYDLALKRADGSSVWTRRADAAAGASGTTAAIAAAVAPYAAAGGAGLVGFSHANTYSAGTLGAKAKGAIDVMDAPYNCKCDGVTDDAANFRLAIIAAQSRGVPLFIHGALLINSAVVIDGALTIIGSGTESAIIKLGTATQDGLQIVTNSKVTMRDLQILGSAAATAGSSVLLTAPGGGVNQFSSFDNVYFSGGWIQLNNGATAEWSCMRCTFAGFLNVGIQIQDTFNTDAGDQQVIGCVFTTAAGVGTGIVQLSAGGLRLVGCKFIQIANGLTLSPASGVNISDLFLTSNSFESFTGAAVTFTRGAGNLIGTIHICGNEFVGGAQAFNMSDVGPWINNMVIIGNTFGITGNSTCVTLAGVLNCTFANNILNGNATGTGLNIGTVGTSVQVHQNTFSGFTTNIAGAVAGVNGTRTNRNVVTERNLGYNPVGASALSPTASPWTFTNGSSTADLYLNASTQVTGVTINGNSILPAALQNTTVRLGPNEVAVVTYTGTLTGNQMVH